MGKSLFVTGTGTDVGKTYVTALIVKKLRKSGKNAGYYKAAISGAERDEQGELLPGDALYVNETARIGEQTSRLVSYVYPEAVSPHLAAKLNRCPIDFQRISQDFQSAKERYDYLTMEGSGGSSVLCAGMSRNIWDWMIWYTSWDCPYWWWLTRDWERSILLS